MTRLFEFRTYDAEPGKLEALKARFRDHTIPLFAIHGIEVIGFWETHGDNDTPDKLLYLLAFADKPAADAAWAAFRVDPSWIEARTESETNGPLVAKLESVFMSPTDFSPLV
jgi:hypothetical protein